MSSNHRIKLLDLNRHEPPKGYLLCRANGGKALCNNLLEYDCSFIVETKGGRHVRHLFMCARHAYKFATKHHLLLPILNVRARTILKALEENMKYRIRYADGHVDGGFSLKTVVNEARRTFTGGFARTADEDALFPVEDLEIDDVIAGPVKIYRQWPDLNAKADAFIEKEDDLEVTHANGIAGRKITVEEDEGDDGLGACQGYAGGGRHA